MSDIQTIQVYTSDTPLYTSAYDIKVHKTNGIRVHIDEIRVHTSDIRVACAYIRVTYKLHTRDKRVHRIAIQITCE